MRKGSKQIVANPKGVSQIEAQAPNPRAAEALARRIDPIPFHLLHQTTIPLQLLAIRSSHDDSKLVMAAFANACTRDHKMIVHQ